MSLIQGEILHWIPETDLVSLVERVPRFGVLQSWQDHRTISELLLPAKQNFVKGDSLKHTTDNHLQFITGQIFIKIESIKDANQKKCTY